MKIAIDARFFGTENGGLGRYTINLIEQLSKLDTSNQYYLLLREKYYKSLTLTNNFEKILIHSRHYSVGEQFEIVRVLNKIKPDLTHFLHFNVPFFFSKKYIVTIHDLLMHEGVGKEATTLSPWKYSIKRMGYRSIFDHAVNNSVRIIVPTQFVKEQVTKEYPLSEKKISVLYEGTTNMVAAKHSVKLPDEYFLYVGNAYPHKNIQTLVKAATKLPASTKLVLVTPRDVFTKRLKEQIQELKADNRVILKNNVSDQELAVMYKKAKAFVYPSFSEGFGLPGLEALLLGTRLVSSDIPVFHEVYGKNATYFNPKDWEDLSVTLLNVINEKPETRKTKIKTAQQFVMKYSWEKMAREVLQIYKEA